MMPNERPTISRRDHQPLDEEGQAAWPADYEDPRAGASARTQGTPSGRIVSLDVPGANPSRADLAPLRSLVVSRSEAAHLLGVSLSTVKDLIGDGRLPVIRIGSRILIERSAIRAFIRASRTTRSKRTGDSTARPLTTDSVE